MPRHFTQSEGLLIIPPGYDKYHVSWTRDNVLTGFKTFYQTCGRWPNRADLNSCQYLPNIKTIERSFGGIISIRKELGIIEDDLDHRKGHIRSDTSKAVGIRGMKFEKEIYRTLVRRFHKPYVHHQSVVYSGDSRLIVDFSIFYKYGNFLVDVFYPDSNRERFSNNVAIKYRTYRDVHQTLYLCIGNTNITEDTIQSNIHSYKTKQRNKRVILISYYAFMKEMMKCQPFPDPFC